ADTLRSPCSTFKIVIALMGYDAGIIEDEDHPKLPYKNTYPKYVDSWKQPHTPRLWFINSCLWYSQFITHRLGLKKMKAYLNRLNYGNQDLSGTKGKNNALTSSWISSSLEISPRAQLNFIEHLFNETLPFSPLSQKRTKAILVPEKLPNGWTLHFKTGSGYQLDSARKKIPLKMGWCVGWMQKGGRTIFFIQYIKEDSLKPGFAGNRIKSAAIKKLEKLVHKY
ncbi:MAG: class D beta-lactamase, partial [Alphaproteobacteria bacterium]|nr:class D beta-lactamase [Alphaproteobacteria bacterium]MBX9977367.1 class D beta-lactamase [Alphaproteobacteria bacterium]